MTFGFRKFEDNSFWPSVLFLCAASVTGQSATQQAYDFSFCNLRGNLNRSMNLPNYDIDLLPWSTLDTRQAESRGTEPTQLVQ